MPISKAGFQACSTSECISNYHKIYPQISIIKYINYQIDYWLNLLVSLEYMLKKVGEGWQFASENNLEDFVWGQLNSLFELSPLKRQYTAYGDICDILALDKNSRLVIMELKNVEDSYSIS